MQLYLVKLLQNQFYRLALFTTLQANSADDKLKLLFLSLLNVVCYQCLSYNIVISMFKTEGKQIAF